MSKEVYEWHNDGHRVLVVLDGDSVRLKVICPGDEPGKHPGLKCGMADHVDGEPVGPFCWVTESMGEIGLEAHCTGIAVGIRDEMTIEWGYIDDGEFYFKCAGYPSWQEVKTFREEAFAELLPGEPITRCAAIAKAIGLQVFKPWDSVDPEIKDQLREEINDYFEEEERKRNA